MMGQILGTVYYMNFNNVNISINLKRVYVTIGCTHKNEQLLDWPFTKLLLESLYIKQAITFKSMDFGPSNC